MHVKQNFDLEFYKTVRNKKVELLDMDDLVRIDNMMNDNNMMHMMQMMNMNTKNRMRGLECVYIFIYILRL